MDERTLELFNNSFESCVHKAGFLERFYTIFTEASPEVRDKFKDTDLMNQIRMVRKSLLTLTVASSGAKEIDEELTRLGLTHGAQGLKIGAHLYDLWMDCLLQTVREFDPRWSPEVEASWRAMFSAHLSTLKSHS